MRNFLTLAFVSSLIFLTGCAKKPEVELQNAIDAMQRAIEADAPLKASNVFAQAESKLDEGKKLINKRKYKKAGEVLIQCVVLADNATTTALAVNKEEKKPIVTEVIEVPKTRTHLVIEGDCLWFISYKYYKDSYQWTSIYQANINTINNPDLIFPNQVLDIP